MIVDGPRFAEQYCLVTPYRHRVETVFSAIPNNLVAVGDGWLSIVNAPSTVLVRVPVARTAFESTAVFGALGSLFLYVDGERLLLDFSRTVQQESGLLGSMRPVHSVKRVREIQRRLVEALLAYGAREITRAEDRPRPVDPPSGERSELLAAGDRQLDKGDRAGATAAYERAVHHPDPLVVAAAALRLAWQHAAADRYGDARASAEQALAQGDPAVRASAAALIGLLSEDAGDVDGALAHYRLALGGPEDGRAALRSAHLTAARGDLETAEWMLRRALQADDRDLRAEAGCLLARRRRDTGDVAGALALLRAAMADGSTVESPRAALDLALLLPDDAPEGEAALRFAVASRDPDAGALAALVLGGRRRDDADEAGAAALFRQAMGSSRPDVAAEAAVEYAVGLGLDGQFDEAEDVLRDVIAGDETDGVARALYVLGLVKVDRGDPSAAAEAWQRAVATGHPEWAPLAADELAGRGFAPPS